MSAIAGVLYRCGRPVTAAELHRMLDAMAHRAPDGRFVWHRDEVGFGHGLLRALPVEEQGVQPYHDPGADIAITADARIDNREELIHLLDPPPDNGCSISDSGLILHAYRAWGTACVTRLVGDFAFALWDARERHLFCARDHVGIKPFFYHLDPAGAVSFGSEIGSLIRSGNVAVRPNDERIADYLTATDSDPSATFFQDVFRLPPGHFLIADRQRVSVSSYWRLDPTRELGLSSDQEYVEAFRHTFVEAVRCRMRGAGNVGATLSGGMDSSSIVCVARDLLREEGQGALPTFSLVFDPSSGCDETPYIRAVLDGGGCDARLITFDHGGHRPISVLKEIQPVLAEPFFAPNAAQSWQMYGEIQSGGGRVLLHGHGGDEVVSHGYGYLAELARDRKWILLAQELWGHAASGRAPFIPSLYRYAASGLSPLLFRFPPLRIVRRGWRRVGALVSRSASGTESSTSLIAPALAANTGAHSRQLARRKSRQRFRSERDDHFKILSAASQTAAIETIGAVAGAHAVELRLPFWDRRLVDLCLALPSHLKRSGGVGRVALRRAMEGTLPRAIQDRRDKIDFASNFFRGVYENDWDEVVRLEKATDAFSDYIDVRAIRGLTERIRNRQATVAEALAFSRSASLVYWLEALDRQLI